MKRLLRNARFPLALLGAAGLAACVVSVDFSMDKNLIIDTAAGITSVAQVVPVDLGSYKEIQEHKSNVDHLNFNSADLTVTEVRAGNHATAVSGKVALRASTAPADGSQDVQVTQLNNFAIATGVKLTVKGSPALDAFLMNALKGDGKFSVVVSGTTDGEAHFTLNSKVNASLGYGVF